MNCATRWRWGSQRWTPLSRRSFFCPTRPTDLRRLTSGRMKISFVNTILTFVVLVNGHHMTKSFQDPPRGDLGPSLVGVEPSVQSAPGRQNHPRATGDHFVLEINVKHGAGVGKHGDSVWVCGRLQSESPQLRLDRVPPCIHPGAMLRMGRVRMKEDTNAMMQVATFSVYAYFTAALFGRQFLEPRGEHKSVFGKFNMLCVKLISVPASHTCMFNLLKVLCSDNTTFPAVPNMNFAASGPFANHTPGEPILISIIQTIEKHPQNYFPDVYIPIFTIVEFISYLGWIKVWFPPFLTCLHCSSKDTWWIRWQKPFSIHLGTMTKTLKWIIWSIGTCR